MGQKVHSMVDYGVVPLVVVLEGVVYLAEPVRYFVVLDSYFLLVLENLVSF